MGNKKKKLTPAQIEGTIQKVHTECIRESICHNGPLYVRAVMPSYAEEDASRNAYSYWYLAHVDSAFLDQEKVESYLAEYDDDSLSDGLAGFLGFLETKGYIVLNTALIDDGAIILTVND